MCLIKTTTMVKEVKHSFILPIVLMYDVCGHKYEY